MMKNPIGTRFGGWLLNTADNIWTRGILMEMAEDEMFVYQSVELVFLGIEWDP